MDQQEKNDRSTRRYEIDPEVVSKMDHIPAMLHLWVHGRLIYPVEDLDTSIYKAENELSDAQDNLKLAMDHAEETIKLSGYPIDVDDDGLDLLQDIAYAGREAVSRAEEAHVSVEIILSEIQNVVQVMDMYKEAVDELITEHHPEIPEAIEKAKLMKELS